MDAYTLHLLGLALERCPWPHSRALQLIPRMSTSKGDAEWAVEIWPGVDKEAWATFSGNTLADALRALLDDLGVQYPERPSAERVAKIHAAVIDDIRINGQKHPEAVADSFPSHYKRDPVEALAWLEGS